MEVPEQEAVWRQRAATLSRAHVYCMARSLGSELQALQERCGPDAVSGIVPQVVRLLELLEEFSGLGEELLFRAAHDLQLQGEEQGQSPGELAQNLVEGQGQKHCLQNQLSQLQEENQKLLLQITENQSQKDSVMRKETEVMMKLKKVVDRQRDEIRAKAHEIFCKNKDTEALQEQLDRFLKMNEDLRRKLAVVQAQLKSNLEKKAELEILVQTKQREMDRLARSKAAAEIPSSVVIQESAVLSQEEQKGVESVTDSNQPFFTKEDVKQILQERNELKTNLFLVQEELAYYHRELLNDQRTPALLLDAMKSAIKKQRKKIKAKMLGIVEEVGSSGDEDGDSWLQTSGSDCVDSRPPESKIRSLFGLWYRNSREVAAPASAGGVWEIIDSQEVNLAQESKTQAEKINVFCALPFQEKLIVCLEMLFPTWGCLLQSFR
ncbi:LOW QUALITY PROTEIN: rab-interacting lysosomal protein [Rhinatrema bivittatum]|uniref:LOW QUALITY PROTEIN: rab-interacting lysosomal protein n=1 Tax=Rhinatrema bivittatum TaxID=194408 RepID=UPI00112BF13E|nr:LOW QUALITY PROTEIN: rab-interacting lysosomal protein [Rhinatrema bivittatum]